MASLFAALLLGTLVYYTGDRGLALALLQISTMLSFALAFGGAARILRQPPVLGEILGGIILGPTLLGYLFPDLQSWLFPRLGMAPEIVHYITFLGLIAFVFTAGLEVDLTQVMQRGRAIALTSALGILLPFTMGALSALLLPQVWGFNLDSRTSALIAGATLSISALPVIARILMDLGLAKKEVGTMILTAATIDDALGWMVFAFIVSGVGFGTSRNLSLGLTSGFFALAVFAIYMRFRCQVRHRCNRLLVGTIVELTSASLLGTAVVSEALGAHGIFGAFLGGMVLCEKRKRRYLIAGVRPITVSILAPLYFASIGLKANFATGFYLPLVLMVLVIACTGKLIGASLGAKASGMSTRDALMVSFGMNARGAVEIVLATLALESGLIDQKIFVALVIMALVTTMVSGMAMQRLSMKRLDGAHSLTALSPSGL